jgi:hypothetical protein
VTFRKRTLLTGVVAEHSLSHSPSYDLTRTAFLLWSEKVEASSIHCLKQMGKTIRNRLNGPAGLLEAREAYQYESGGVQQYD